MEGVYEAVVARLSMLGYTVTDADKAGLEYLIHKCEVDILTNINHRELPKGLFYTLVDMVAGQFLFNKKAAGGWRASTSMPPPRASRRVTSP